MRRLPPPNGSEEPWLSGLAPVSWQFSGEASLAGCRRMRTALAEALQALALTDETSQALLLGVTELATNVVCHSSPPAERLFMVIRQRGGRRWLELRDDGAPFDPILHSLGERSALGRALGCSGYGLKLVAHLLPALRYQRLAEANCYRVPLPCVCAQS